MVTAISAYLTRAGRHLRSRDDPASAQLLARVAGPYEARVDWDLGAGEDWAMVFVDGDLASNNHGWQWVAGTGTDAAPYFRVFNPVSQGRKFDPDGDYVRRWVPELAHLAGGAVHEPWKHDGGYDHDYPKPVVDHAAERQVALDRYAARTPS